MVITTEILGLDFLQQHGLVLDFSSEAITLYPNNNHTGVEHQQLQHMVEKAHNNKPHIGIIAAVNGDLNKISEECAIPDFGAPKAYELPDSCGDEFKHLIEEYNDLFCTTPGKMTHDCCYIPTKGPPIRNLELTNGNQSKVVHVNRVHHRQQPDQHLNPSVSSNQQ